EARGLARLKLGDYPAATADFSRALELEPESARLFAYRGSTYLAGDAPGLALQDFDQAIGLDGANADAYTGRGLARVKLGKVSEGVADAREALRRGPLTYQLAFNAARVYAQAAGRTEAAPTRTRYQEQALDLIRRALELQSPERRAAFWR